MAVNWTSQQKEVIESAGCNLLVSAAAGSGKTAVLVERIIEMLTRNENPVDIDRLLVVTFTRAAAAEMRDRIGRAIDKKLENDPGNRHLQHQKLILQTAQISTIHSLCKTLIQENFETLEIDPSFRMGEENELKILQQDVAKDMLEGYYASGNLQFREFVDRYAGRRSDEGIAEMIVDTYGFSRACAAPDYWLDSCETIFSGPVLAARTVECAHETVKAAIELLQQGLEICLSKDGPYAYAPVLESDIQQLSPVLEEGDYDRLRDVLRKYEPQRMPGRMKGSIDEEKKELVKMLRDQAKKSAVDFTKDFLKETSAQLQEETEYLRPSIHMLAELVKELSVRFQTEKAERGMMDFNDLEHETLRLLAEFGKNENGELVITPTAAADRIAACYDEVICDEYQDSNEVQELILELVSGIRSGRNNRFMVGDVKQSIYRFRQADSMIFVEKAKEYAADGTGSRRIDLNQNFRSRLHILDAVNLVFRRLMQEETCGICYDEREALRREPDTLYPDAAAYRTAERSDVVLVQIDKELMKEEEKSKAQLEAVAIADKILALTDPETGIDIFDSSIPPEGGYRRAKCGDIAILLRSLGENAEMLVRELSNRNIPVSAQVSKGFFETTEVRTMTALLQIIDNPEQDIPAAAVLRAPFVGLSSEELALLRASCPADSLITACRSCGEEQTYAPKVRRFLEMLEIFRRAADYMEMDEFIRYLYEQTGYYALAAAMPSGLRRQANLDLLLESAVSFTKGSLSGLFSFVRYLDQIRKNQYDAGEASPDAAEGSVRIMTIHKSKGLEFPIVILGSIGKEFNWKDLSGTAILHRKYGIGMDAVNLDTRRKLRSASKRFIARQLKKETLAEEMRILYVAMTRAKEKLVMVGSVDNPDKKTAKWKMMSRGGSAPAAVLSAGSYLDWIMPAVLKDQEQAFFRFRPCDDGSLAVRKIQETGRREGIPQPAAEMPETEQGLSEDAAWSYPYENLSQIKGKYSVTELKARAYEKDEESAQLVPDIEKSGRVPSFMKEEEEGEKALPLTGAMRGTAFHLVMELLDFASCPKQDRGKWLQQQIAQMQESGKLRSRQAEAVFRKGILKFLDSGLGKRMIAAALRGCLHRESQFVMSVPAGKIDPQAEDLDKVVVQGIVDAWFTEEDKIIILDYKTDRVSEDGGDEILADRYAQQLEYYAMALSAATGLPVAEKWIYSFHLDREISVS